jgi:YVTN family beta-propeller protein
VRRRTLPILASLALSVAVACAAAPSIFVSNEVSGDISVISPETLAVVATIPVGKRPRGLKLSPDGRTLYVALSGSPAGGPGVDAATLPPADKSADGIGVIDVAARRLTRVLRGMSDPEQLAVSADGARLFVASEDEGVAVVLDAGTGATLARIDIGPEPEGTNLSPDGHTVYVTSEGGGTVSVLDASSLRPIARIPVGLRPRSTAFAPDGTRAYVMNEAGASITVIDTATHRSMRTLPLPDRALLPMGGAVSADGATLFVSTGRGGRLLALHTADGSPAGDVVAGARPWGLAACDRGKIIVTANGPSNDVAIIDARTLKLMARISVGQKPWGVACRFEGGR